MSMSANSIRAGAAFVEILADDSKARRVLRQFQAHTQSWATTMNNLGRAMLLPAVGFGIAMGKAVKTFAEFERQMSRVKARLEDTDNGFAALEKSALNLAKTSVFSARQIASAMAELAQAGNNSTQILEKIKPVIDFAAAAEIEMAEAAIFATTAMNTFGLESAQLGHMLDIITKGANISETSVSDMANAFSYAAPSFKQVGASVQDLSAALAILAHEGQTGDRAGTALRGIFTAMADPSERGAEVLREMVGEIKDSNGEFIGLEAVIERLSKSLNGIGGIEKLGRLSKVFDNRMVTAITTLVSKGPEAFRDAVRQVDESLGNTAKMAATQLDNLSGDFRILVNNLEVLSVTIGKALSPLRPFVQAMTVAVQIVNEFATRNPVLVRVIVALGVAFAAAAVSLIALSVGMKLVAFASEGLLLTMTALRGSIWLVAGGFQLLTSVAIPLIGIIGTGLVAAFRALAAVMLMNVGTAIKALLVAFGRLWLAAHIMLAQITVAIIKTLTLGGIAAVTSLVNAAIAGFSAIGAAVAFLVANPISLLVVALIAIGAYIIYASGAWTRMINTMGAALGRLANDFKWTWAVIANAVQSGRIDLAFNAVCILMKIIWLEFIDFLMTNWEEFADFLVNVWDEAVTNTEIGIARMTAAWQRFFDWLGGMQKKEAEGEWGPWGPRQPGQQQGEQGGKEWGPWGPAEGGPQAGIGFGGSSPLALAASLMAGAVAATPPERDGDFAAEIEKRKNSPEFQEEMRKTKERMEQREKEKRERDERAGRTLPPSVKGPLLRNRTPEQWAQAKRDQRENRNGMNPNRRYEDGGLRGDILRERPDMPADGPMTGRIVEAERSATAAQEQADKRAAELEQTKQRFAEGKATAEDVRIAEINLKHANRRAESRRKQVEGLKARRDALRNRKNKEPVPPADMPEIEGEKKPGEGDDPAPPEKPPQLPASLQAANEEAEAARKALVDAESGDDEEAKIKARLRMRQAERNQKKEQGKFDRRQGIEEQRKKLDEARKEAEAALGERVPRGEPGSFLGDMLSGAKASVVGTFSAAAAGGLGAGNSTLTKIASATEATAKNTKDLKNKKGGQFK